MTQAQELSVDFDFRLDGKVALVTGAASGIGAAIASAYATKGARIAAVDLNAEGAEALAAQLGGDRGAHRGFACDVADAASVQAAADAVAAEFGRIDILVNSAGVARLAPAEELSLQDWDSTLAINLRDRKSVV